MAKYSIDGTTLTGIADAIRTQYGDESPIAVTDMAEAILGIEGGGGETPLEIDCGEITLTSNITSRDNPYQIAHSGGKLPIFALWYSSNYNSFPSFSTVCGCAFCYSNGGLIGTGLGFLKDYQGNLSTTSKNVIANVTDEYFEIIPYDTSYPIRTNDTLKWLVIYS